MAADRIQKGLQDIPPEHFPIWGETLDYDRGMPQFREPPQFSEEGVLELIGEEYTYRPTRRLVASHMQASSRLSLAGHAELQDNSPPMALPLSQNQYGMGALSYPASQQQTTWVPAQSTSSDQLPGGVSSYDVDNPFNPLHYHPDVFHEGLHYTVCGYPPELPAIMEGIEQTYPRAMHNMPGSTSAFYPMQWSSPSSASTDGQVQCPLGHDGPMTSPQSDGQMAELVPTPPYDTNNASGDLWHV